MGSKIDLRAARLTTALLWSILWAGFGTALFAGVGQAVPFQLLVTQSSASSVLQVDPNTGATSTLASGFSIDIGIAVNNAGDIFIASPGGKSIIRIDPTTGTQTTVSAGGSFVQPESVAVDAAGDLLVTDAGANAIFRVDPITGAQTILPATLQLSWYDIASNQSGNLFVTASDFPAPWQLDPTTGAVLHNFGCCGFFGLGMGLNGAFFVTTGGVGRNVVGIDPITGAFTGVWNNGFFVAPLDVAMGPDGDLYVTDPNLGGSIIRVDPVTSLQTVVASGLGDVRGIAVFPALIPEPRTALLFCLGLMGLGLRNRANRAPVHSPHGGWPGGLASLQATRSTPGGVVVVSG